MKVACCEGGRKKPSKGSASSSPLHKRALWVLRGDAVSGATPYNNHVTSFLETFPGPMKNRLRLKRSPETSPSGRIMTAWRHDLNVVFHFWKRWLFFLLLLLLLFSFCLASFCGISDLTGFRNKWGNSGWTMDFYLWGWRGLSSENVLL